MTNALSMHCVHFAVGFASSAKLLKRQTHIPHLIGRRCRAALGCSAGHDMAPQHSSPAPVVFGPFEVNAHTGELRKRGVRVRLSGQPFHILLLLLAKPGELVTREELREQLWSDGTFVDFEHGVNAAINKLRRALDDSAEHPRYIETAPGRGYRFIGTLEREPDAVRSAGGSKSPEQSHEKPRLRVQRWLWAAAVGRVSHRWVCFGLAGS